MKVSISIIATAMMAVVVESFVPQHYTHGIVKRIIEREQKNEESSLSPSVLCNRGAFGYCNSWGYVLIRFVFFSFLEKHI